MLPLASALKQPEEYGEDQCELIAKDFQKKFGGSLIWIQPIDESGAYILEDYSAHILNKVYMSGNNDYFYIDWKTQSIIKGTERDLKIWYWGMKQKESEIFDLSEKHPPFSIIWRY